ncbi:hypothetical protein F4819DRAFT_489343 [Hypoxylon fuscum]|nr:hypothetical protein F4819DRAFT_489343 [Hypoxylon fuscum]
MDSITNIFPTLQSTIPHLPPLHSHLLPVLLLTLLATFLATYCAAITLYPSPPLPSKRILRAYLAQQGQEDWVSLDILMPSLGDLLVAHWALFWRRPVRAIV